MELIKETKNKITTFLKLNGFVEIDEDCYSNDYCSVEISERRLAVCDNIGQVDYSAMWDIFWLVGVLILNGYINSIKLPRPSTIYVVE